MEPTVTTLEDLLPLVRDTRTCREFGAVVIAHVPIGRKKKLAMAARDAFGREWADTTVKLWLSPSRHSDAHAERGRAASRACAARSRSTPEGKEKVRVANQVNNARLRSTEEGREKTRAAGRASAAKIRATPEGREKARAASRAIMAKWVADGRAAEYMNARYRDDPAFRAKQLISGRIRAALTAAKQDRKATRTVELLGCSAAEFMAYLEARFVEGMTWDNQGTEWHVDHVRPLASFDLADPAQQREAFHYTNCQPLWARDNLSKGSLHGGVRHRHGS
ncbi:MAG: hypothetical protein R3E44_09180 [Paracoccaceae bacterium]